MKKYINAIQGNLEVTAGKTIRATLLSREGSSILVQLENGMFATMDFDTVFMKCGHTVWSKMVAAKSKYETMRVRITHITYDLRIKVIPYGKFEKYTNLAKNISDTMQNLENLKRSIRDTYNSLERCYREGPYIEMLLDKVNKDLDNNPSAKNKRALLKEKARLEDYFRTSSRIIEEKELFIKEASYEILKAEEILKSFDLLLMAS